jgi:hypothetical protein
MTLRITAALRAVGDYRKGGDATGHDELRFLAGVDEAVLMTTRLRVRLAVVRDKRRNRRPSAC